MKDPLLWMPPLIHNTVESEVGRLKVKLQEGSIRRGNVGMYFQEANVLVPGKIDPQSKTPAFKRVSVRIL